MVVKGLIKSIDFNGNTCKVRIPLFESAGNKKEIAIDAIIATQPGIYNSYRENDVVIVAFENNEIDMPVVIGKLYLGAEIEGKEPRGAINIEHLKASSPISIPIDTELTMGINPKESSAVKVDGELAGYKTIADIAKQVKKQGTQIGSLNAQLIDDGKSIGLQVKNLETQVNSQLLVMDSNINAKVDKQQGTATTGFGWNLNLNSWTVYRNRTVDGLPIDIPLFTVNDSGVSITGTIKIKDSYTEITRKYIVSAQALDEDPRPVGWRDLAWQLTVPTGKNSNENIYEWEHIVQTRYVAEENNWRTIYPQADADGWYDEVTDTIINLTGADGVGIDHVYSRYMATATNSRPNLPTSDADKLNYTTETITAADGAWTLTAPTLNKDTRKYLWVYDITKYTNDTLVADVVARPAAVYGDTGEGGEGIIAQITFYYAADENAVLFDGERWDGEEDKATSVPTIMQETEYYVETVDKIENNTNYHKYELVTNPELDPGISIITDPYIGGGPISTGISYTYSTEGSISGGGTTYTTGGGKYSFVKDNVAMSHVGMTNFAQYAVLYDIERTGIKNVATTSIDTNTDLNGGGH